jgi:HEAT repeat protein
VDALSDPCWPIRRKSAECLARMKKRALPKVIRALKEENQDVRFWARRVLKAVGPSCLGDLHDMLINGDADTKIYSTIALGETCDKRSIPYLSKALVDDNEWVRRYAATALSEMKHPDALKPMLKCFETEDEDMCLWVAKSISSMGEVAVEYLLKGLESENENVERYCASALAELRDERAIGPILKLYMTSSDDQIYWMPKDIKKFGSAAVKHLVKYISDSDDSQTERVCEAVSGMESDARKVFLESIGKYPKSKIINRWKRKISRGLEINKPVT